MNKETLSPLIHFNQLDPCKARANKISIILPHFLKSKCLSIFILLTLLTTLPSTIQAYQINLNNMSPSNISSVLETENGLDDYAFDGNMDTAFIPAFHWQNQVIQWGVSPSERFDLPQGHSVAYYTFTLNLRFGTHADHNLNRFYLEANTGGFSIITNYIDLSTNNDGTITSDELGNVTVSSNSELAVHTLQFNVDPDINFIALTGEPNGAQGGNSVPWHLAEIDGTVTAEINVPETSTFALLTGLIAFVFITYRKRAQA